MKYFTLLTLLITIMSLATLYGMEENQKSTKQTKRQNSPSFQNHLRQMLQSPQMGERAEDSDIWKLLSGQPLSDNTHPKFNNHKPQKGDTEIMIEGMAYLSWWYQERLPWEQYMLDDFTKLIESATIPKKNKEAYRNHLRALFLVECLLRMCEKNPNILAEALVKKLTTQPIDPGAQNNRHESVRVFLSSTNFFMRRFGIRGINPHSTTRRFYN